MTSARATSHKRPIWLAMLAAFALLLAACGGTAQEVSTEPTAPERGDEKPRPKPDADAKTRLAAVPDRIEEVGSGRFEMTFTMQGMPDMGEVSFSMKGAFNAEGQTSMTMDFGDFMAAALEADPDAAADMDMFGSDFADVFSEPMEIVVDGDTTYMRGGFVAMLGGPGWLSMPTDESASDEFTDFGAPGSDDPFAFVEMLREIGDVEELGTDTINGVEAIGFRVEVDPVDATEAFGEDASDIDDAFDGETLPFEVWVSADGLPVRLSMVFDEDLMGAMDETGEMDGVSMSMQIDFFDLGEDVEIEVPDPSEVTPFDEANPLGMFGDLGDMDFSDLEDMEFGDFEDMEFGDFEDMFGDLEDMDAEDFDLSEFEDMLGDLDSMFEDVE